MTNTDAKNFYDTSNEVVDSFEKAFIDSVDANLSVIQCKEKCNEANNKFDSFINDKSKDFNLSHYNKFLKALGQSQLDKTELLETCYK